jgi:hypothetical protein
MRYAAAIWLIAGFALWDEEQNRGQYTQPVAHIFYRLVGGN